MSDSNVISTTDPQPDDHTIPEEHGGVTTVDPTEYEAFRAWKENQASESAQAEYPWKDTEPAVTYEAPATDAQPSDSARLAALEYQISKIPPEVFNSRAPFTNPIDDPNDPPAIDDPEDPTNVARRRRGNWNDHPWNVLVKDEPKA